MGKPRKHAEVIKQWADGKTIQFKSLYGDGWVTTESPEWADGYEYRVKPERVWPVTSMTFDELMRVHGENASASHAFFAIANAAIKRHIEDTESTQEPA